jgi:DNA-directed RNA polymerase sigma subunit (sigma70/sigma32)
MKIQKRSPMSFEEIAEVMGISKQEVKRIYSSAIRKLQRPSKKNQKLWEYLRMSYYSEDNKDIRFE